MAPALGLRRTRAQQTAISRIQGEGSAAELPPPAPEPAAAEPAPTESVLTEPAPTEPAPTEPAPVEPAPTGRVATGRVAAMRADITQTSFRQYVLGVVLTQITVIGTLAAVLSRNPLWVRATLAIAALSAPFAAVVALRPVIRRLAFRSAVRRPRQIALVLLGVTFGAALVTSALVIGDSVRETGRREVLSRLGPIDVVVETGDRSVADRIAALVGGESNSAVGARLRDLTDAVPLQLTEAELPMVFTADRGGGAAVRRGVPHVQLVRVDFGAASGFGGDPSVTGIEGSGPGDGRAVLTQELAAELGVRAGETVEVIIPSGPVGIVVDRVVGARGVAGITTAVPLDPSRNAFVSAATFDRLLGGANANGVARVPIRYLLALSAKGGVAAGAGLAASTSAAMQRVLEEGGVQRRPLDGGSAVAVESLPALVTPIKTAALAQADRAGALFSRIFGGVGAFGVLAGLLLLVNVVVLFADGRRAQGGTLRALGMRRMHVVATYATEGWAYSLVGAVVGSVFGVALGWILLHGAGSVLSETRGTSSPRLFVRMNGVLPGVALSFAMALATVVLTALHVSNITISGALRGAATAERRSPARTALVVGGCAVAGMWLLFTQHSHALPLVLAVGLLGIGLAVAARGLGLGRVGDPGVAFVVAVVCVLLPGWAAGAFSRAGIGALVAVGLLAAVAAVCCVASAQHLIGRAVRAVIDRLPSKARNRATASRLGVSYLQSHRFRTALAIATYTLVVLTLSFVSVVARSLSDNVNRFTDDARGGYDVVVHSRGVNPLSPGELGAVPGVVRAVTLPSGTAEFALAGAPDRFRPFGVTAITVEYVAGGAPALGPTERAYATAANAYGAVASENGLVIVSANLFAEEGRTAVQPGDPLYVRDVISGRSLTLRVAAVRRTALDDVSPVLVGESTFRALFGTVRTGESAMLRVADGSDPRVVAADLNSRQDRGVEAVAYRTLVRDSLRPQLDFLSLLRSYLALGLVLGVVGLAVVTMRAVRDRRRDVGVLRALGFDTAMVRRMFMVEAGTIAVEGTVLGVVLGVVLAWRVSATGLLGASVSLSIPYLVLGLLIVVTSAVSVLAARRPASAAARLTTADALRAVE